MLQPATLLKLLVHRCFSKDLKKWKNYVDDLQWQKQFGTAIIELHL